MNFEPWCHGGCLYECVGGGLNHVVNGNGHMIGAYLQGQPLGTLSSGMGGVSRTHVASGEEIPRRKGQSSTLSLIRVSFLSLTLISHHFP